MGCIPANNQEAYRHHVPTIACIFCTKKPPSHYDLLILAAVMVLLCFEQRGKDFLTKVWATKIVQKSSALAPVPGILDNIDLLDFHKSFTLGGCT
jgi:hypothetical protein